MAARRRFGSFSPKTSWRLRLSRVDMLWDTACLLSASSAPSPVSAPIGSRVAAYPVGELGERAAELAFQASDVGTVADALEPLQHHRHFLAVLPDLFDWRLRERNRPTQRSRQDFRRLRHRSNVTGEIDLAAVQCRGIGERARA